jgi:hypothetical protein
MIKAADQPPGKGKGAPASIHQARKAATPRETRSAMRDPGAGWGTLSGSSRSPVTIGKRILSPLTKR